MLFTSWSFLLFLVVVWVAYRYSDHRSQNVLLLVSSYFFYGWWDPRFLLLLLISTLVDFRCGQEIEARGRKGRPFLFLSLMTNLGILGFFKYFDFFVTSAAASLESLGMHANLPLLQVVLPVGISFYTFQTMAYTIDIYRGKERATDDFVSFAVYVAYFPQLVAGPIERSTVLLPQIRQPRVIEPVQVQSGLELILMGFVKKLLIADSVAPYVDQVFDDPTVVGRGELLLGVYLFALQIYGDFAGYTDIARGVSRLFGIELGLNFRQPYLSTNITEFWRRWHISLSSWLRDYLYIPLGGSRNGPWRTYRNNFVTMVLGGLWHGASWNFVVWGALHGLYLAAHKLSLRGGRVGLTPFPASKTQLVTTGVKAFVTFQLVCVAWVFFRAKTLEVSRSYFETLYAGPAWMPESTLFADAALTLCFFGSIALLLDLGCWWRDAEVPVPKEWVWWARGGLYGALIALMLFVGESDAQPFIYFQF